MAGVIKSGEFVQRSGGARTPAYDLGEMSARAEQYLASVREEAKKIVEAAHREAETVRQQARVAGQADARRDAEAALQASFAAQTATALPALQAAAAELVQARQRWVHQWNNNAIQLSAAIAARIVRRELARNPQITIDLVTEALQLAAGEANIQLRLNPQDVAALGEQVQAAVKAVESAGVAEILPDPEVTRGGCRVVTRFGVIDQQLETQLARIEEELTDESANEPGQD